MTSLLIMHACLSSPVLREELRSDLMLSSPVYISVPHHIEHDVKELQGSLEVKETADPTATITMDGGQTLHKHLTFRHCTLGHGFRLCMHTQM